MTQFTLKTQIKIAATATAQLQQLTDQRIWVGCDPFLTAQPFMQQLLSQLEQHNQVTVFSKVKPEPPIAQVAQGVAHYLAFQPTQVLAIGGGSAIDTVKAVRYMARQQAPQLGLPPLYVMPSTSGTGSEVTSVAVITDPDAGVKYPLADPALQPDVALLHAELVQSCPPQVTAYSGLDTLTHGLEALVAQAATPLSDGLAEKAVALTFQHLPACYQQTDTADYATMQSAACMAGIAFENAGLGLTHAIAHQFGSRFHIAHGLACAIVLPHVVQWNAQQPAVAAKYTALARQLWPKQASTEAVAYLLQQIQHLKQVVQCPARLRDCQVTPQALAQQVPQIVTAAQQDFTFGGNPRVPTEAELIQLIVTCF
jgi:1-propanol dehydrogenase